jgi:hypothetical protein
MQGDQNGRVFDLGFWNIFRFFVGTFSGLLFSQEKNVGNETIYKCWVTICAIFERKTSGHPARMVVQLMSGRDTNTKRCDKWDKNPSVWSINACIVIDNILPLYTVKR